MNGTFGLRMTMAIGLMFGLGCGDTGFPQSPPPTSGFAYGAISQFGSIFVNGTKFDTDDAKIVGGLIDETSRPLGQVVRVEGTFNADGSTGTATRVVFKSQLKGPINALADISMTEKEMTVLGVSIIVEEGYTAFSAPYDFASILVDDIVEVSGLLDGAGVIRATRIELEGQSDGVAAVEVELRGITSGFLGAGDFSSGTLTVGDASVVYDGLTQFEAGFEKGDFSDSVSIKVKGMADPVAPSVIFADEIESEGDFGREAGNLSLEGFISEFFDVGDFTLGQQRVDASEAVLSPPSLVLADGMQVELEGPVDELGVLRATEVKFEGEELSVSAVIAEGALGEEQLTFFGSLVVRFDNGTRWEDKVDGADDNAPFAFSSLQVGDYVEIRGLSDDADADILLATRIERDDLDGIEIEGPVDAICADPGTLVSIPDPSADPNEDPPPMIDVSVAPCVEGDLYVWIEILGIRVEIHEDTDREFGETDCDCTVAEFIDLIGSNFVELEIAPPGDTAPFVAGKAEIELPEAPAP